MKRILILTVLTLGLAACSDSKESQPQTEYTRLAFETEEDYMMITAPEVSLGIMQEGGKTAANNLDCKLYVPSNHEYLINKYNSSGGTSYVLLPENAYRLNGGVIAKGEASGTVSVSVDLEKAAAAYNGKAFILPVKARAGEAYQTDSRLMYLILEIQKTPEDDGGNVEMKEVETINLTNSNAYIEVCYANTASDKAVIFCPGGGYGNLTPDEITMAKEVFKNRGMTLVVLHYRLPGGDWQKPYNDAAEAVEMVKENASKWGGYESVGIMGCSAGGHLASLYTVRNPSDLDFQILLFPLITMDASKGHYDSVRNFLGNSPSEDRIREFSTDLHVTGACPPAYIAYSDNDSLVNPEYNSVAYADALRRLGIQVTVKQHATGDHWWGGWSDYPASMFEWLENL